MTVHDMKLLERLDGMENTKHPSKTLLRQWKTETLAKTENTYGDISLLRNKKKMLSSLNSVPFEPY